MDRPPVEDGLPREKEMRDPSQVGLAFLGVIQQEMTPILLGFLFEGGGTMPEKIIINAHALSARFNYVVEVNLPASFYFKLDELGELPKSVPGRPGGEGGTSGRDNGCNLERQFARDASVLRGK